MNPFIDTNFLLETETARVLYHQHAAKQPIIDYHCHLDPRHIAENHQFANMTEIWLGGDHYKWRAMRGNGVDESFITGDRPAYEKFEKWVETVPYTMRNPLYHWSHMELSRIFGIDKIVKPETAREIYDECTAKLQTEEYRAQALMQRCGVELVCTTDDPADLLQYHQILRQAPFGTTVLPTWRPDKAMAIENPVVYNAYLTTLEAASDCHITTYAHLLAALQQRHDYFATIGCRLSDHGMDTFYADEYTTQEIEAIFEKVRLGKQPSGIELSKFRSAMLFDLARMDYEKGWAQQFHLGVIRNNKPAMFRQLGPDIGFDAIHDVAMAASGHQFFGRLSDAGCLGKTILYNLNPKDNEMLACLAATFNDGTEAGKIQFGSGWWFLDQEVGMTNQLNTLSVFGLLSRFVGMLTDSRSFLSYPRHEYFRRILCNLVGGDVEKGKLPASELPFIGSMIEDISYRNAKQYFGF